MFFYATLRFIEFCPASLFFFLSFYIYIFFPPFLHFRFIVFWTLSIFLPPILIFIFIILFAFVILCYVSSLLSLFIFFFNFSPFSFSAFSCIVFSACFFYLIFFLFLPFSPFLRFRLLRLSCSFSSCGSWWNFIYFRFFFIIYSFLNTSVLPSTFMYLFSCGSLLSLYLFLPFPKCFFYFLAFHFSPHLRLLFSFWCFQRLTTVFLFPPLFPFLYFLSSVLANLGFRYGPSSPAFHTYFWRLIFSSSQTFIYIFWVYTLSLLSFHEK